MFELALTWSSVTDTVALIVKSRPPGLNPESCPRRTMALPSPLSGNATAPPSADSAPRPSLSMQASLPMLP